MKKIILLLPALILASCAPSVTGGASRPQEMASPSTPVVIRRGETRYVQFTYPRTVVTVNDKYFSDLKIDFGDRSGNAVSSPRAYAPWLKMTPRSQPRGVNIALNSAYIVKDIRKTDENPFDTTVSYYEVVRVILKVTADSSAAVGRSTASLEYSDGNARSTVPVVVDVQTK